MTRKLEDPSWLPPALEGPHWSICWPVTPRTPAEAACRNLDWETLLSGLDGLSRRMIVAFARGDTMRELKAVAALSDSGMSGRKRRLVAVLKEVLGADCLANAGREPAWRWDVAIQREKDACRHDNVTT